MNTVFDIDYWGPMDPTKTPYGYHGRVTLPCETKMEALKILSDAGGCIDEWEPGKKAIPFSQIFGIEIAT